MYGITKFHFTFGFNAFEKVILYDEQQKKIMKLTSYTQNMKQ